MRLLDVLDCPSSQEVGTQLSASAVSAANTATDSALAQWLRWLECRPWAAVRLSEPLSIERLPTPALVLDRAAFERNLRRMQRHAEVAHKSVRPHCKTHKCPIIAQAQVEVGAVGLCAAKVSEAWVLVNAGITDVLITSPVTRPGKVRALAALTRMPCQVAVVVDSALGLELLVREGLGDGPLGVLLDVDVEMGRTGLRDIDRLKRLRDALLEHDRLRFDGIQHYAGHLMHVRDYRERRQRSLAGWARVCEIIECLERDGPKCRIVTGGGTGTYDIDCRVERLTDLQVGSYAFMDREYQLIGSARGDSFDDFEVSLTLAATVISQPGKHCVTFDAGTKALASDTVAPILMGGEELAYQFAGDEHGLLSGSTESRMPRLGDVRRFVTPHCDPTINLHELYWVLEADGLVHSAWPITARGCSW